MPDSLEHVEVTNQSPSNHSRTSSNSSTPQRENSAANSAVLTQADITLLRESSYVLTLSESLRIPAL